MISNIKYSYTQSDCITYCLGRELYKFINQTNKIGNFRNVMAHLNRSYNISFEDMFKYLHTVDINKICLPNCPLECDKIDYEIFNSHSELNENLFDDYRNDLYYRKFSNNMILNQPNASKDMVYVNIYFLNSQFTRITQLPKREYFDLISSIGGIIGIFMGISFLSFFELVEFVLEILIMFFSLNNKVNNRKKETIRKCRNTNIVNSSSSNFDSIKSEDNKTIQTQEEYLERKLSDPSSGDLHLNKNNS